MIPVVHDSRALVNSVLLRNILPVGRCMLRIRSARQHLSRDDVVVMRANWGTVGATRAVAVAADVHG